MDEKLYYHYLFSPTTFIFLILAFPLYHTPLSHSFYIHVDDLK